MGTRHVLAVAMVLAALSGCAGEAPAGPPGGGGPPPPPPGGSPPPGPPPPDRSTAEAYVADLRRIDPAIVGDGDLRRLVDLGRDQCAAVRAAPDDRARLIELTNRRFAAPEHPGGLGESKAAAILDVVRERICPTP